MSAPRLIWEKGTPKPPVTSEVANSLVPSIYPTVRELIQNALDASETKPESKVKIAIRSVPWEDVPGLEDCEEKLEMAFDMAEQDGFMEGMRSHHRDALEALSEAAEGCRKGKKVRVLTCTDNGKGMTPKELDGLFRQVSSKGDTSAGSYGQGNLANYRISGLRYILYAARYCKDDGTLASVWSGSAFLPGFEEGGSRYTGGAHIATGEPIHECFPALDTAPELLAELLPEGETGATVAILGVEDDDWGGDLLHAVASSFFLPILEGTLQVEVEVDGESRLLGGDGKALEKVLEKESGRRAVPKDGTQGVASGGHVWSAYRTYMDSKLVTISVDGGNGDLDQVQCWIRTIEDSTEPPTKVIFRNGMWIARDGELPGQLRDLAGKADKPRFGAVMSFMSEDCPGSYPLLKVTEPPAHDGFNLKLLRNAADRSLLSSYCKQLAERVLNEVPSLSTEEGVYPPLFILPTDREAPPPGDPKFAFCRSKTRKLEGKKGRTHEVLCRFEFEDPKKVEKMYVELTQQVGDDGRQWESIKDFKLSKQEGKKVKIQARKGKGGAYKVTFPKGSEGSFTLSACFRSENEAFSPALKLDVVEKRQD